MSNEPFRLAASPAGAPSDSAPTSPSAAKPTPRSAAPPPRPSASSKPQPGPGGSHPPHGSHKAAPPEQTHAEDFYYVKQIQARTKLVIVLRDGEEIQGIIEWYDKTCIKVTPNNDPPVVIYKAAIKYMYKQSEG